MLAFVLAAVAAATPSPKPYPVFQPPPTIIQERVSPVCSTLHKVVLPLARMQSQYRRSVAAIKTDELQLAKYSKTKLQDGVQLYASKIDQESTNLIGAIHQIEELLQESYAIYPVGKVAKVDALRQRVQNIVDLQRATADRYAEIYGTIVDNYGTDELQTVSKAFGSSSAGSMGGAPGIDTMPNAATPAPAPEFSTPPPSLPADYDPRLANAPPNVISAHTIKYDRLSQLNAALVGQGRSLIQQALIAAHDCDGT
ncbi:MAG TPA: hypothetical protein VFW34_05815 [Candidatus Rubrimentiphilum sp.]|nr:hypothetical protein [Candidatus Rubrimentiphilum sp.]